MESSLWNFISSICQNYDLLPDDLYEKSRKESKIDTALLEAELEKELNEILSSIAKRYTKFKFDCNDSYSLLRRILPREGEFTEDDSHIEEVVAHIYISHDVFKELTNYLDQIVNQFARYQNGRKEYFVHYAKIQNTLEALRRLCEEHERYVNKIYDILNDRDRAWYVDLPYPRDIIDLIASAFIDLKNGVLSTPLLRSYLEIDIQIVLENTINNLLRQSADTRYKDKKVLFQRSMEFSDIITLVSNFAILDGRDIDIISRIQDYTSRSAHIGTFFDRLVSWHLLFYLQKLKHNPPSIQASFTNSIEEFVNRGKMKVVPESDVISDYSRYQPTSKQLRRNSGRRGL
jgi:hypothetical protein